MVRQAPGGNSSICLGMDNSPQKKRGVSANVFASGDNQNAGNFLTDRPTTRVVSAPGGASSCPFATDPDVNLGVARRPPVGGKVSVKLGDDCTHMEERKQAAAMARRHEEQQAKAQMERTAGVPARFDGDDKAKAQPAGIDETTTEQKKEAEEEKPSRQNVGGNTTICLGTDEPTPVKKPAQEAAEIAADAEPEEIVKQNVGGDTTICLGTDEKENLEAEKKSVEKESLETEKKIEAAEGHDLIKQNVGGDSTICLGTDKAEKVDKVTNADKPPQKDKENAAPPRIAAGKRKRDWDVEEDSTSGSGEPAQKRRAPPGGYSSISLG